jgi:GNAT superfamily N-acetyltransferase
VLPEVSIRRAEAADAAAVAHLRAVWGGEVAADAEFEREMADWMAAEGERRTTFLAELDGEPIGMASLFEYRRMPRPGGARARWGYVGNMFVVEHERNRGVGAQLLNKVIHVADERRYVRLVLSPSERSVPFYARAGFRQAAETTGHPLLVRPSERRSA